MTLNITRSRIPVEFLCQLIVGLALLKAHLNLHFSSLYSGGQTLLAILYLRDLQETALQEVILEQRVKELLNNSENPSSRLTVKTLNLPDIMFRNSDESLKRFVFWQTPDSFAQVSESAASIADTSESERIQEVVFDWMIPLWDSTFVIPAKQFNGTRIQQGRRLIPTGEKLFYKALRGRINTQAIISPYECQLRYRVICRQARWIRIRVPANVALLTSDVSCMAKSVINNALLGLPGYFGPRLEQGIAPLRQRLLIKERSTVAQERQTYFTNARKYIATRESIGWLIPARPFSCPPPSGGDGIWLAIILLIGSLSIFWITKRIWRWLLVIWRWLLVIWRGFRTNSNRSDLNE